MSKVQKVINTKGQKNEMGNKPALPKTLEVLQALRTSKGSSDLSIHNMLDEALTETSEKNVIYVLERILLHIGDVSREHNILKELGIKSDKGGSQEREIFRSILRWWERRYLNHLKNT